MKTNNSNSNEFMKEYITFTNVSDFDAFIKNINLYSYMEVHEAVSSYDSNAIVVPEDKLMEALQALRSQGAVCVAEPTYMVFEGSEDITSGVPVYETNDIHQLQEWLTESADEDSAYSLFKHRQPFVLL